MGSSSGRPFVDAVFVGFFNARMLTVMHAKHTIQIYF
jgi:hypothetical protein